MSLSSIENSQSHLSTGHANTGLEQPLSRAVCKALKLLSFGIVIATVFSFLAKFGWPFEVVTNFRAQLLFASLILILFHSLVTKDKRFVLFSVLLALSNAVPIGTYWLEVRAQPTAGTQETAVRLVLANLLFKEANLKKVISYSEDNQADILVITELPLRKIPILDQFAPEYPHIVVSGNRNNQDVAILSKYPITDDDTVRVSSAETPILNANLTINDKPFKIVTLHPIKPLLPGALRARNEAIRTALATAEQASHSILVGDFNATIWSPIFWNIRKDWITSFNLQPTWLTSIPLLGLTIDQLFTPPSVSIVDRKVGPFIGSDHYPVIFDLKLIEP